MVIVDKKKKIKNRTRQFGTSLCPRVVVSKSNTAIYCQLIDDSVKNGGKVLAFCSSKQLDRSRKNCNISLSRTVGENMGKKIVALGYKSIVFDRSSYVYHGKVAALAEGIRSQNIKF